MLWANCTQFQKKEGLLGWVEWALTALPFIAALSFIQTHKGCVREGGGGGGRGGGTICLPKPQKKFQENRDVFPTSWAIRVLLPEPHPTSQRENPAEIAARRRLGYSVQALCQCLPLSFCLKYVLSLCSVFKHTHAHTFCHLVWAKRAAERDWEHRVKQSIKTVHADTVWWDSVRCSLTMAANQASLTARLLTGFIFFGQRAAAWHCMPPTNKG